MAMVWQNDEEGNDMKGCDCKICIVCAEQSKINSGCNASCENLELINAGCSGWGVDQFLLLNFQFTTNFE